MCSKYYIFIIRISMIKDTLLICSVIICFVLLYRIYVISQKINNLEEKFTILDNFSQTMFTYISAKDEQAQKENIVTYSNNEPLNKTQSDTFNKKIMNSLFPLMSSLPSNNPSLPVLNPIKNEVDVLPPVTELADAESDSESETYSEHVSNNMSSQIETINSNDELTDAFETKEIVSDMVSQLKESLLNNNDSKNKSDENKDDENKDELFNILNNADIKLLDSPVIQNKQVNLKKKEEELMKMKMTDLKSLAKKKNIQTSLANKPKKKETIIQELLNL